MSQLSTPVKPYPISHLGAEDAIGVLLVVNNVSIAVDQSVSVSVTLMDSDGTALASTSTKLTDEQNASWGADNSVIPLFAAANLGLTPA